MMAEVDNSYSQVLQAGTLSGWDYMAILWRQRHVLLLVIAFFLITALVVRFVMPQQYQGDIGVVPAASDDKMSNVVGTLANLGLLRNSGGDQRSVALATLQSRDFLQRFIVKQKLMPILFASEWDSEKGQWASAKPPTLEKGYERLYDAMTVVISTTDQVVRLRVRWRDPVIAASLANNLVKALNQELQLKAIREADRMIAALTLAYRQTTIQELHANIANLIEAQLHQRIMIQSRPEYAVQVVDPALPSSRKVSPGLVILLPVGLLLGLLFGVPAAFFRHAWKMRGTSTAAPSDRKGSAKWQFSFSR